jgi:MerR family transcriptional regulator, light-induced transcriptional regulator
MAGMSVGEVAGRLGVSASAVRMWGRRYGLTASERSAGGHRRFSDEDFARLVRMQDLVTAGTDPAAAAASVLSPGVAAKPSGGRGGPGGAVLAVPGADARVRGLARAAARLQEGVVTAAVLDSLGEHGVLPTWNDLVLPVLVAAGEHWHGSGAGIEIEHLLTQAVVTAFTAYAAGGLKVAQPESVVVACGPGEDHVLTLHALRAALSERGIAVRFLGARTPLVALSSTVRLTRAPAVFVWATMPARLNSADMATLSGARRGLTVAVGGPGWSGLAPGPATRCESLEEALAVLEASWRRRSHTAS